MLWIKSLKRFTSSLHFLSMMQCNYHLSAGYKQEGHLAEHNICHFQHSFHLRISKALYKHWGLHFFFIPVLYQHIHIYCNGVTPDLPLCMWKEIEDIEGDWRHAVTPKGLNYIPWAWFWSLVYIGITPLTALHWEERAQSISMVLNAVKIWETDIAGSEALAIPS